MQNGWKVFKWIKGKWELVFYSLGWDIDGSSPLFQQKPKFTSPLFRVLITAFHPHCHPPNTHTQNIRIVLCFLLPKPHSSFTLFHIYCDSRNYFFHEKQIISFQCFPGIFCPFPFPISFISSETSVPGRSNVFSSLTFPALLLLHPFYFL